MSKFKSFWKRLLIVSFIVNWFFVDVSFSAPRILFGENVESEKKPLNADDPKQQILIKAHIVNIDKNFTQSLGFVFSTSSKTLGSSSGFTMNLPVLSSAASGMTLPIAELGQGILLEATLDALEQEGHAESISDPQLLTLDGQSAILESGQEVPYQQTSENGGTTVAFKKAVLSLKVTPHIQSDSHILLNLTINQDQVSSLTVNGVPAIKTQQLQTQVLMKNQSTLVLGGLFEENSSEDHQRVPFISRIPIIGYLFHHRETNHDRRQLLILVTPIIAKT